MDSLIEKASGIVEAGTYSGYQDMWVMQCSDYPWLFRGEEAVIEWEGYKVLVYGRGIVLSKDGTLHFGLSGAFRALNRRGFCEMVERLGGEVEDFSFTMWGERWDFFGTKIVFQGWSDGRNYSRAWEGREVSFCLEPQVAPYVWIHKGEVWIAHKGKYHHAWWYGDSPVLAEEKQPVGWVAAGVTDTRRGREGKDARG